MVSSSDPVQQKTGCLSAACSGRRAGDHHTDLFGNRDLYVAEGESGDSESSLD